MLTITPNDIFLIIIGTTYTLGVVFTLVGLSLLINRGMGKEVKTIAVQTSRLVQKGIAEDIAGLVGNASTLLDALNQLVRNTAGIGVFLTLSGLLMLAISAFFTLQIFPG